MAAPTFSVFVGSETGLLKGINVDKDYWRNLNEIETPDKSNEIRSLSWNDDDQTNICVGLRDKRVGSFDVSKQCFTSITSYDGGPGTLKDVFQIDDRTVTAIDSGVVNVWQDNEILNTINTIPKQKGSLTCMVHSQYEDNVIATGGKEPELKLWDLNDTEKPTFTAKNVKNNWLNLEVPVWVTGVGFLSDKKIVTSTGILDCPYPLKFIILIVV